MADGSVTVITDIEGLDELEEAFTQGSKRAVKKFLSRVSKKAGKVLQDSASERAPYLDGELSEDIHMNAVEADGALVVRVGPSQRTFYGLIQEVGAPEANIPAQHWLEQSAIDVQDEVCDAYIAAINEGLEDMKG